MLQKIILLEYPTLELVRPIAYSITQGMSMAKYLDLMSDYGFKKIFGHNSNKPFLIDYLNSLISSDSPIKSITYLPTEHIGQDILDRSAIFDLLAESETGEKFLIELQQVKQKNYADRALFYSTFPIQSQAKKGIWNYQLKKVFVIGILNFALDDSPNFLSTKMLLDVDSKKTWTNKLQFINVEIPKFTKDLENCHSQFDIWNWHFKNLGSAQELPNPSGKEIFEHLESETNLGKFQKEELENYQMALLTEENMRNFTDCARDEGIEIGIEKGINQAKIEMVKSFLAEGVDINIIAKASGLSLDEIQKLNV